MFRKMTEKDRLRSRKTKGGEQKPIVVDQRRDIDLIQFGLHRDVTGEYRVYAQTTLRKDKKPHERG